MATQQAPTPEVLELAAVLEAAVSTFLRARPGAVPGEYESVAHAWQLANLLVRNVEAVHELARIDLVLLPAAMLPARAAFEAAVKCLWLLDPADPFERECRWMGMMHAATDDSKKLAARLAESGANAAGERARNAALRAFANGVAELLIERGYQPRTSVPDMASMCESLGVSPIYVAYRRTSAYVHSSWAAIEVYQRNLGTEKVLGEWTGPDRWLEPLSLAWWSLSSVGRRAVGVWDDSAPEFPGPALAGRWADAVLAWRQASGVQSA